MNYKIFNQICNVLWIIYVIYNLIIGQYRFAGLLVFVGLICYTPEFYKKYFKK